MAELPSASVTIDDEAGAFTGLTGYVGILACVGTNADGVPRVFSSAKALLAQHDYAPGVDLAALHMEATKLPVLFVPMPVATAGVVGRQDSTGVAGTCAISVSPGAGGYLEETECEFTVVTGGTIGTNGIVATFTADGGRTEKTIRLGTAVSYAVPYLGIVLNFAAGTLIAGDTYTFTTTAPMWDQAGLADARDALAAQSKQIRSMVVVGDIVNSTVAGYVTTEINGYSTENNRCSLARVQVRDRLPLASAAKIEKHMLGAPTLSFLEVGATGDTITRSAGSWITDGFAVGDVITVAGSVSNNVTGPIASLSATVITLGTTDLVTEAGVANCTVVGSAGLTFAEVGAAGDTITRSAGSWLDDGFAVGDDVTITGTALNNVTGAIASLSATVLTFDTTDLAAEVIGSHNVTIVKGETMAGWVSTMDAALAAVDAQIRIDLGLGRARKLSPITGWEFRRGAAWAASCREYQHDVQIPTWRKSDGPLDGWDLEDGDGTVVEYDERTDGGALAARFTCFRTYANGPHGTFLALSLTRGSEASMLSRTHNVYVANIACNVAQAETENAIGQVLVLNPDGTATEASLGIIESRVNTALQIALLQSRKEGPRASSAVWTASRTDILNIPAAEMNGVLTLELNGTLEKITTVVRIQTAG